MTHRSLMTLPVALLAAAVIATPAWAGEDEDDPTPTPTPTTVPTVEPTATPAPAVTTPVPVVPPAATPAPVPQVVPVVKERNAKAPKRKHRVHHKRTLRKIKFTPRPVAVIAAQVAATPVGGVQAGEGGTAPDDGGVPLAGLLGGGFLLLLAGGTAVRAGVRH